MLVRRVTNSIRRRAAASLRCQGEARKSLVTLAWWISDGQAVHVVGDGTTGKCGEASGETCAVGERRRSQSLHGTAAVKSREKRW